ncbi:MAG: zinc dependent phospholipase C family protein [Bacteroidota bacterium]
MSARFTIRISLMALLLVVSGLLLVSAISGSFYQPYHQHDKEDWGFYGHRKINRMAVFTLPQDMIPFFKQNIEYITEHAIDPDKRRYATKHEAVRHYIDIDHHGTFPFPDLPRNWTAALARYSTILVVPPGEDTIKLVTPEFTRFSREEVTLKGPGIKVALNRDSLVIPKVDYLVYFKNNVLPQYYRDDWNLSCTQLDTLLGLPGVIASCPQIFIEDGLSEFGIIPWHLNKMYYQLVNAYQSGNPKRILRTVADFGHYVGDAHVPLHTTTNYNGQLTNQLGIHAFWETRLVELFSDEYDYFVGPAEYIENPNEVIWETILESHILVDSVLAIEKRLSKTFPQDQQFCFEQRLSSTVRTQCTDYARAFHNELKGMVEDRFCKAIKTLGDLWYSAWVDAGQPNLLKTDVAEPDDIPEEDLDQKVREGKPLGRQHTN